MTISCVIPTILDLNGHLRKSRNTVRYCRALCNVLLTSFQRRFYEIFQNCGILKQVEDLREEKLPFVDNIYLLASALDPLFSYHWIEIDVEMEHDEALTSRARHDTKRKIEELIVKEGQALARKDLIVAERESTSS